MMDHLNDSDSYRLMRNSASSCRSVSIASTYIELAIIELQLGLMRSITSGSRPAASICIPEFRYH